MKQLYDCRYDANSDFKHCPTDQICAAREAGLFVEYTIDKTYPNYFDNWFNQMDLMCVPPSRYMAIGSVLFFFAGVAGLTLYGLADKFGKKKVIVCCQTMSSLAQLIAIYWPNYWMRLACFAVIGICQLKNG
jgi:MFS family permease